MWVRRFQQERSHRAPVKKKVVAQRRLPKKGTRPVQAQDGQTDVKDQPAVLKTDASDGQVCQQWCFIDLLAQVCIYFKQILISDTEADFI